MDVIILSAVVKFSPSVWRGRWNLSIASVYIPV